MGDQDRFGHLELDSAGEGVARTERTFDAEEYVRKAGDLEWNGEHDGALRLYARALSHNPHHEGAWVGQLRCLVAVGDNDEAILWAEKAAEYLPRSGPVRAWKAVAVARTGATGEAQTISDDALRLGNSPDVWLARGWVHGTSRPEPAARCMDKALELGGKDPGVLLQVASFYTETKRYSRGLKVLQELTAARPAISYSWYLLGQCYGALGMRDQAVQALEQAVSKAPTRRAYREALLVVQGRGGLATVLKRIFRR